MQMTPFPGCCGARIFVGFPAGNSRWWYSDEEKNNARENQQSTVKNWLKGVRRQMSGARASHAYVTLNNFQADFLHDIFVEDGWQVTSEGVKNPNTNNKLNTYLKIYLPEPRTKKKEPMAGTNITYLVVD